ncbi:hypothetical protein IAT40_003478 [Kwoniella sp. CBS 6097]
MSLPYTYTPFSPYPNYAYPLSESMNTPSPIYTLLIIGMVFFMAANVMPNLIPAADRVWHVAPMVLQWGFLIIIFALMVQMTGLIPGVPQMHITYVHMATATLLFILMWNHIVSQTPPAEEKKSSSSSAKKEEKKPEKKKEEKKQEEEKPQEPSPWDDLRAHPSTFLTTRLNKLMPWPFPMGKAARAGGGSELWWEKGMPSHVGHFNRTDPEAAKKAAEAEKEAAKKKKLKEEAEKKAKEKAKAEQEKAAKLKEKEKAEAEAKAKVKAKEEELRKAKEEAKKREEMKRLKAIEDRHKLKMWRTKYLAMIIGISMLNKTLGFLLLLFFSLQLVSQELNEQAPAAAAAAATASASASTPPSSSSSSSSTKPSSSSSNSSSSSGAEKEKAAKLAAAAATKEKEKAKSSSSSSSSSSSKDKDKDKSKEKDSTSKVIGSEAVKKAAGSKTVTHVDPDEGGFGVPYKVGFGMHYIHTPNPDKPGSDLTLPSLFIPSEGMSHPLMTTTYRQYAN